MDIAGLFKQVLEPMGINIRTFVIDYQNNKGDYYSTEVYPIGICSDNFIVEGLIKSTEEKGFTVYAIHELLDGYGLEKIEIMAKRDPLEAIKHIKPKYLDLSKERKPL